MRFREREMHLEPRKEIFCSTCAANRKKRSQVVIKKRETNGAISVPERRAHIYAIGAALYALLIMEAVKNYVSRKK